MNIRKLCILLGHIILINILHGQDINISRYIDFSYSEVISYSSNLFLANDAQGERTEDLSFNHVLTISHSDKRRLFSYSMVYNVGYTNFLLNDNLDFSSQNISAQISIPRKYYTFFVSSNAGFTSELETIEFNDFIVTFQNTQTAALNINLTQVWNINLNTSYQAVRFPDLEDSDNDIFSFSAGTSYRISDQISWNTGVQYRIVLGQETQQFPSINLGLIINSQIPGIYWLKSISFDFGFTLDNSFNNPMLFDFSANGNFDKVTSWSFIGTRDITFSIIEDAQIQTNVSFSIQRNINQYFSPSVRIGFQHAELQDNNNLVGANIGISAGYNFTNWSSMEVGYIFATRDDGENVFFSHTVSATWTISF